MASPDNSLACELVAQSVVKKALGVTHVTSHAAAVSPTAPSPEDHTVNGADQSECQFFGYNQKPSNALLKQLRSAKKPVPAGLGNVVVTTEVRDDEVGGEGENWDPTVAALTWAKGLATDRKVLGGASFTSPSFASFLHRTDWLGNKDRNVGFYEVGDGGDASAIVVLTVNSADPSHATYKALAKKIVPAFTNVFLTP
ncbi:MAG TPA: hypothetical protein VII45_05830 [Solirubrobacterales bacterium]